MVDLRLYILLSLVWSIVRIQLNQIKSENLHRNIQASPAGWSTSLTDKKKKEGTDTSEFLRRCRDVCF